METKTCTRCGTTKPIEEYYKSPGYRGGRHTWCKECVKKYYHDRYKAAPDEFKERNRAYRYSHPEVAKKILRTHDHKYPEQRKARNKVYWAIESGRMPHPKTLTCRICSGHADMYHHWSYLPEHWCDVIPLCRHCHGMLHKGSLVHPDVPIPNTIND